jgi:hypothetical protein
MEQLDPTQAKLFTLVERFVQRQHLVVEAIKEIRPDLLSEHIGGETKPRPPKEYIRATQAGDWGKNKEWDYFIHGGGCRLIHKVTKEPIEWNAPDINKFDPYWFCNWVQWLLSQSTEDESEKEIVFTLESRLKSQDIKEMRKIVFELLNQLRDKGRLVHDPDRIDMYALSDIG